MSIYIGRNNGKLMAIENLSAADAAVEEVHSILHDDINGGK